MIFRWDLRRSGHGRHRETPPGFQEFDLDIPAKPATLDISVSRPIVHVDYPGKLVVPWIIGTNKVKKVQVIYADANNNQKTETIPDTVPQGMLPVDATVPHRSFRLKVDYYDSEGKLVEGNMSEPESLPMVHAPVNFKATPQDDGTGSVLLTWDTDCFSDEDLLDGDLFEIERSITGREEDFAPIGSEMFDTNLNTYSFKDSTILASLNKDFLDEFLFRYENKEHQWYATHLQGGELSAMANGKSIRQRDRGEKRGVRKIHRQQGLQCG